MSHHVTEPTEAPVQERPATPASIPASIPALAALVAAPVLVLVASLTQASPEAHDTASELASIAAAPGRYQLAGVIGWCAMVLYVPALIALARPVRRPRLAGIGLAMSMTGLVALISLMGSGPVSLAMAQSPEREAMIRVTDAYESAPLTMVWMLVMVVGFSLGPVVLGFGLWRSGFPWAVPVLLLAGLVVQMLDAGRWPLALGYALTAAGMALVAVVAWRRADPVLP